jgi:hypothetical protein
MRGRLPTFTAVVIYGLISSFSSAVFAAVYPPSPLTAKTGVQSPRERQ